MSLRPDQVTFSAWEPSKVLVGRLHLDSLKLDEDEIWINFSCEDGQKAQIHANTHLLLKYANESANFLEFDQLPINKQRMWVSEMSNWLEQVAEVSGRVFEDVSLRHYLFVFSNASIEIICLSEPCITIRS